MFFRTPIVHVVLYAVASYAVTGIPLYFYMGRSRFVTHIADSKAAKNAAQEPMCVNTHVKV